jgi:hypothetical protein
MNNAQDLKFKLKNTENILLTEVLIRSLKGNQNNTALPATIRSNQRNLFSSAVAYSKALISHSGYKAQVTNRRMDTISTIVELLNDISPNADYVVQDLVEFLRVLARCSGSDKINTDKYAALLHYFRNEVENEFAGKETTLNYNNETNTISQTKQEVIYGA